MTNKKSRGGVVQSERDMVLPAAGAEAIRKRVRESVYGRGTESDFHYVFEQRLREMRALEEAIRRFEELQSDTAQPPQRIDPIYCTDDYPREGCTIVVELAKDAWSMKVYAPGFKPVGCIGMIESYAARPHGSAGIAVDAFIKAGADWRHAIPAMRKAERSCRQSSESGSSSIE